MKKLTYVLLADGSSDATLLVIIKWLLNDLYPQLLTQGSFADLRIFPNPPKTLKDKINKARVYYPHDILFVHRDAESIDYKMIDKRIKEIEDSIDTKNLNKTISIIPIKMMESWLLIDEDAIRKAAGNRNYKGEINLPHIKDIEKIQQPKQLLFEILREVSGLKRRNLDKFNEHKAVHDVAEFIENFSLLRTLKAFQTFESQVKSTIDNYIESSNS